MARTKQARAKTSSASKPYDQMTAVELARATKKFERGGLLEKARPLTATQRERWKRAKSKMGRPPVGEGSARVLVTVERGLLRETDKLAKKLNTSRAAIVSRGLRAVLENEGVSLAAEVKGDAGILRNRGKFVPDRGRA